MHCEWITTPTPEPTILHSFHPAIAAWWQQKFPAMSAPQRLAIPHIAAGKNILIAAPTGTGKTLCAFISILSDLLTQHSPPSPQHPNKIDTVYISPLKALGSDIRRNLITPLTEIDQQLSTPITVAQRTGDTTPRERIALIKAPPRILITTPESLALCLANERMRQHLTAVRRIIIDELHALAPNKRGTDLMLSVERLAHLVMTHGSADPQRIGLSATISPLERMAQYLVGHFGRTCAIADASFNRPLELDIASVFTKTPFLTTAAINRGVYDFLEKTIRQHRTTLVFTNVRSATERVTFALRKRFAAALEKGETTPDNIVHPTHIEAHHSSLDREARLETERRLKAGELRCVVCSTSLELGIDIGTIDRVVLLNSPKGVGRGLQRIGRSGHRLDSTARGTLLPTVPADLIESLVTADAMRKRAVGEITYPKNCLDVLAQHLIGMALQAKPHGIALDDAFDITRRTAPFADLTRDQFDAVIRYIATDELGEAANVSAKLFLENDLLHPLRKSIGALYAQNVGTITQEGQVKVRIQNGSAIGTVEEAFAQILKVGDRFVLGGRCVQLTGSKGMTIEVIECHGQSPTVPRWFSGMMTMETGLAARMREFRSKVRSIAPAGESAIARMLTRQFSVEEQTATVAAAYLHAQHRYADIPVDGQLLVERVPDDGGGNGILGPSTVLVFHTMIGRAANDALARTVAYRIHHRWKTPRPVTDRSGPGGGGGATVVVDDYAFGIWVNANSAARRADRTLIRSLLSPVNFEQDLTAAVETSDLFRSHFRYTAVRAHAILQNNFGSRRFIGQMQSLATRLYEALRDHHPDHLLLTETRRSVMHDILDTPTALTFLQTSASQNLRLLDLPTPSPFAFGLFAAGGGRRDTLQLADTADFLLAMYEEVQRRLTAEAPAQAELFPV